MVIDNKPRPNSSANDLLVLLLAGLFLLLGVGAFGILAANISDAVGLAQAGEAFGTTLLRFLNIYGIILPLLLLGFGIFLILLGTRLFRREARAAAWARQILLWAVVALVVLVIQAIAELVIQPGATLLDTLPFIFVGILSAVGYWWLGKNMHLFHGVETLSEASSRAAWNLLVPTIIVLIAVAARPLERTFIASLTDQRFASPREVSFVGFSNYARLLSIRIDAIPCVRDEAGACETRADGSIQFARPRDVLDPSYGEQRFREVSGINIGETRIILSAIDRDFIQSIGNTLYFTVASVTLELILGLFIAMVINSKFSGRGLMRAAMLVPWAIPTVVSARLWEIMLRDNQSGVINHFFVNIGLFPTSQAWLANPDLQIPALILIDVWKTTPFMALVLLAGLQVIPNDLYEAADVDGASKVRQFFSLTLPLLRPAIAVALVFRTLDAIRVFDLFQVLLGRGKLSMATYNYETLVSNQELGYASAIGVLIFIIILLFTVIYVRVLGVNAE